MARAAAVLALPLGDLADDADEQAPVPQAHLVDRQLQGEGRAVLAEADDLPADADDLGLAGAEVVVRGSRPVRSCRARASSRPSFRPMTSAAA